MRSGPILSAAICLALASAAALAQTPTVGLNRVTCVPEEANQVFNATIRPEVGGTVARLYFRWDQHGAMYYVEMVAAGEGRYWGIPPKPEPDNESIEYYAAVVDPAGTVLARSETLLSPVTDDCSVTMTPQQFGHANNLTVGETVEAQEGRKVLGFLCDGVVTRVNFEDIPRPDEICRGCVIPWWEKNDYIVPAAIAGGAVTLVLIEESPSRP